MEPNGVFIYLFFLQKILVKFFFWGFFFLHESRTINGAKFNFIGIKKIEGVSKIFLKGIQIIFFIIIYNFFLFFQVSVVLGPPCP